MVEGFVDLKELGKRVKEQRERQGLSLRDLASQIGISASTLSRIEKGTGKPDADNIAKLASWLNIPVDRVMQKASSNDEGLVVYYLQEPVPEIVEAHLRADKNLTPEAAKALSELFRVAYQQFSKKK
ncbi:MAG: helix-turn-helix domain-containing protein [Pyrinomonadaceae bacterium]|nr:helix-turn-helix domain-containing protein [Pyrinomonadaceae bacterium]MCX7639695.1 helix-turn-helix domain-containing protein [Pyrinomonadaceae bacterium]MDW8304597.1 helix-turn-helix transcriptional regulator [Acidobacteriota bacterium]